MPAVIVSIGLNIYSNNIVQPWTNRYPVSTMMIIKAPPTRGRLLVFVQFRSPACAGGMDTAFHPCHPDKTAFSIHLVFNILDTGINT